MFVVSGPLRLNRFVILCRSLTVCGWHTCERILAREEWNLLKILRFVAVTLKWVILGVIGLEVLCFLIITVTNFVLWGHAREGSRAVYDPYTLFLQAHGIRGTAYNASSPDRAKNVVIWCLGGSTMRGHTLDDAKTIPSQMVKRLNADSSGLRFSAVNFGMNSFNSLLETKYLQKLLIERTDRPDIIIFYDGANDATYFAEHQNVYGHYGYRKTRAIIESYYWSPFGLLKPLNAALYSSFTYELYSKVREALIPATHNAGLLRDLVNETDKRYEYVNKVASCFGAKFILFWQPMVWTEKCNVPQDVKDKEKGFFVNSQRLATLRQNFGVPYLALFERLKTRPYLVDFRNVLCGRTGAAYQADGVHLTDYGREIVGERMAQAVRERLVPRGSPK